MGHRCVSVWWANEPSSDIIRGGGMGIQGLVGDMILRSRVFVTDEEN
ncbi:hypothetical protein [Coleofasciculus sp. E1-EBD-02]